MRPSIADPRLYILTESDYEVHYKHAPPEKGAFGSRLLMTCSTHVDDIKVAGRPRIVEQIVAQLEKRVGKLTRERNRFMHTGILHEQSTTGIYLSQLHYASQIK
eukprot:908487-Amphidinium_carterae.1